MSPLVVQIVVLLVVFGSVCNVRGSSATTISGCPSTCQCTEISQNHTKVSCSAYNVRGWLDSCTGTKILKHYFADVSMEVAGDGSVVLDNLYCLPPIYDLDLSRYLLRGLHPGMFDGVMIQSGLNLSYTGILSIPNGSFTGLSNLTSLDLSYNRISRLDSGSLNGLLNLKVLDLSFNAIQTIHSNSLAAVSTLKTLNLEHNSLSELTADHLPASRSLQTLNLRSNRITTFLLSVSDAANDSVINLTSLDLSGNPLECSCVLKDFFATHPHLKSHLARPRETVCNTPDSLRGQEILSVDHSKLGCTRPSSLISYPSISQSVLITHTVTLECQAQGFPQPDIVWITPWGEKFYNGSASTMFLKESQNLDISDRVHSYGEYEDSNVFILSHIDLLPNNNLVISKFRGCLAGTYKCVAINSAGAQNKSIDLEIISAIRSEYRESLFIGGCCSVGLLLVGFLIGGIKMLVVWCRAKHCFSKHIFSKTPSEYPADHAPSIISGFDQCTSNSIYSKDVVDLVSERSVPASPVSKTPSVAFPAVAVPSTSSPSCGDPAADVMDISPDAHHARRSLANTLERVRKNVQSLRESGSAKVHSMKESGSAKVHSIKESGTSAAKSVRAGMVAGVETVKGQVQSFKELCGTGNMGDQTISTASMMSTVTDVDTSEETEVPKQTQTQTIV